MHRVLKSLYYLSGRIYLDKNDLEKKGPTLLHISDTPSLFFSELSRLIKHLKPDYIIHTGDLVDNIKLQLHPGALKFYEKEVLDLLKILKNASAKNVYITLGNHDHPETIKRQAGRIHVFEEETQLSIEGVTFSISHYANTLTGQISDFYLFGHDLTIKSHCDTGKIYLNGISGVHLISLDTKKVQTFDYPIGINDARLNKRRIGY